MPAISRTASAFLATTARSPTTTGSSTLALNRWPATAVLESMASMVLTTTVVPPGITTALAGFGVSRGLAGGWGGGAAFGREAGGAAMDPLPCDGPEAGDPGGF